MERHKRQIIETESLDEIYADFRRNREALERKYNRRYKMLFIGVFAAIIIFLITFDYLT
jgi:hypothetical protein